MKTILQEANEALIDQFVEGLRVNLKQKAVGFAPIGALILIQNTEKDCVSFYDDRFIDSKKELITEIKKWI